MPKTYVVHLGNSRELMEIAENDVAKRILRDHVRESLGVRKDHLLFGIINSTIILLGFLETIILSTEVSAILLYL